jgi:maleate isomerase
MPDVLGWRAKFGVIGPSTNTVVEPDYDAMRPAGVTNHYSRIFTPNAAPNNDTFAASIAVIGDNVMDAVKSVLTCGPDYLLMAVSAVSFFGGASGADALVRRIEDCAGKGISIGSHSLAAALRRYERHKPHRDTVALLAGHEPGRDRLLHRGGISRGA